MANKESNFINMVLTLVIVTAVAATALGFIYKVTEGPIEEARIQKQLRAIKTVLPAFGNDVLADQYKYGLDDEDSLVFYPASQAGESVGIAIKSFSDKGYSGRITVMVGMSPEGTINQVSVVEHKETPGLGSKMSGDKFASQFIDIDPSKVDLKVKKDGGSVDAISGATISSRAYAEAVMLAVDAYNKHKSTTP
ncbi:MAG TPA: RnfABCDGE type electron transport complex subunit G [Cyclobacteriaceae bacterium]